VPPPLTNVTLEDNVPVQYHRDAVILLAERGNCNFTTKAQNAQALHSSVVFLVVYNNENDHKPLIVMDGHVPDCRISILFTSYQAGWELRHGLEHVSDFVKHQLGGPLVQVDAVYEVVSWRDLVVSAVSLFFLFVCSSGCLLLTLGWARATNDHTPQATGLTADQLATLACEPGDDTCAICLGGDDDDGEWTRLPCQHVFHADCIAEWLTERQPHCPLCKYDVSQHFADTAVKPQSRCRRWSSCCGGLRRDAQFEAVPQETEMVVQGAMA